MRWIALVVAGLTLAGCTKTVEEMGYSERKALAEQIVQRCYAQGVKSGTLEMQLCTQAETEKEVATRRRQAAVEDNRRGSRKVCNQVGFALVCN